MRVEHLEYVTISGPLPTCLWGMERLSSLLSLYSWLAGYSKSIGVNYNNFHLFLARPSLLKRDSFHPNRTGAQLLSDNINTCLRLIIIITYYYCLLLLILSVLSSPLITIQWTVIDHFQDLIQCSIKRDVRYANPLSTDVVNCRGVNRANQIFKKLTLVVLNIRSLSNKISNFIEEHFHDFIPVQTGMPHFLKGA